VGKKGKVLTIFVQRANVRALGGELHLFPEGERKQRNLIPEAQKGAISSSSNWGKKKKKKWSFHKRERSLIPQYGEKGLRNRQT